MTDAYVQKKKEGGGGGKKNKSVKAVKVAAVPKCQIGLRRATWVWITEQQFSFVLLLESALLLLHTKIGQDFPPQIKSLDTCM